jgi:hypothetical protein
MNDNKIKIKSNRQYYNSKYKNKLVNKSKTKEFYDKYSLNMKDNTSSKIKYIYHETEEKKYTTDCSDLF